jgi:hypothetical protein
MSQFTADPPTVIDRIEAAGDKLNIDTNELSAFTDVASSEALRDFYLIGLWSYCEGDNTDGVAEITYCSSPTFRFWFDPTDVWGLKNTFMQNVLGEDLQKGLKMYERIMGWTSWSFVFATVLTAGELLMSCFAIRWKMGSLMTWLLGVVSLSFQFPLWVSWTDRPQASSLFVVAAATTATVVYSILTGILYAALELYNVNVFMGIRLLIILWLAVILKIAASLIWFLSICCCTHK